MPLSPSNLSASEMTVKLDSPEFKPDGRYVLTGCFLSFAFFQVVCQLVSISRTPKSVSETDFFKWRNTVVSLIHAIVAAIWDISCFLLYSEMRKDLIWYINPNIYCVVLFSTGYFIYDFVDNAINSSFSKKWSVLLHHIAVGGMFYYNAVSRLCMGYTCVALLVEVNSVFLHSRKMLQILKFDFKHWLYRTITAVNLLTFVIFRILPLGVIFHGLVMFRDNVPSVYYFCLTSSMGFVFAIHPVLFYFLLKNDVFRSQKNDCKSKGIQEKHGNNNVKLE